MIECQVCGWTGREEDRVPWLGLSGMDAGCPSCGSDNFVDINPCVICGDDCEGELCDACLTLERNA